MFKRKRPQAQFASSERDAPPTPTAIDLEVARHQGSSVAIEATEDRSEASKKMPTPSLSRMIEQRTWENEQLRQNLMFQQRKHGASMYLMEEVKLIVESLQQALANFHQLNADVDNEAAEEAR